MHWSEDLIERTDEHSCAIYLEVPNSKIVLLQGFFELYEGLAAVRTVDRSRSEVCILTTPSMLQDCIDVLTAIQYTVPWRALPPPPAGAGSL